MSVAIVTGSGGLIGSETVAFFAEAGMDVVGIDNDMRRYFFGEEASTAWQVDRAGVKRVNQGLGRVLAQIQLASHSAEGGPDGVEFTFVGEGGLFSQLGFQPGDVVRRINGVATKTVDEAYQAYEAAAEAPTVRVEVVREGSPQTFTYQLR